MEATADEEAGKQNDAPVVTDDSTRSSMPLNPLDALQPAVSVRERSELSLSPSPSPPGELSAGRDKRSSLAQPGSILRPQNTPAIDASVLKNFRRRPRQPSMLQMVQQRIQSARPSAVNITAQEDLSVFDLGSDEDDEGEDDFAPEAEGTPLHVTKAKARPSFSAKKGQPKAVFTSAGPKTVSSSRKRTSEHMDTPSTSLAALRAKKRKSGEPEFPERESASISRRKQAARQPMVEQEATPEPQNVSEVQVLHSSPLSSVRGASPDLDIAVPSTEEERHIRATQNGEDDPPSTPPNGTMADPASSSPLPPDSLTRHHPEELADPVTQVSPPRPERRKAKQDKSKPISTATLQSLLPKRRQPPKARQAKRTEYDFISSSDAEDTTLDASHLSPDEDELGGRLRRRAKPTPTKRNVGRKSTAAPTTTKHTKTKTPQTSRSRKLSTTQARKSTAVPQTSNQHKTYSRRATLALDKENHGDDSALLSEAEEEEGGDSSADPLPDVSIYESAELEAAKRKFAAVDKWDMEFESMSAEDHRSSSLQWR